MNVMYCDKCGAEIKQNRMLHRIEIDYYKKDKNGNFSNRVTQFVDLCDECRKTFLDWLGMTEDGNRREKK